MKRSYADKKNPKIHLQIFKIKTLEKFGYAFLDCSTSQKNENDINSFESNIQKNALII